MEEKDFSLRLAQLRIRKGVSARDMSLSIGQNPGYIYNIEAGKSMPSLSGIFYICEYSGISPSDFFDLDACDPSAVMEIVHNLKKLNYRQLEAVAAIVQEIAKD